MHGTMDLVGSQYTFRSRAGGTSRPTVPPGWLRMTGSGECI